jgi:RimJ/RimL family protein N-acetyltransferase
VTDAGPHQWPEPLVATDPHGRFHKSTITPEILRVRTKSTVRRTGANHEEIALGFKNTLITTRLEVRPPRETDRVRFTELFRNDAFMVFSSRALSEEAANRRFDHMLDMCEIIPFSKQPIIERASGVVVGYTGVDYFTFEDEERLEWGYRLVPESRGLGYATEASEALLACAGETFSGELLAIIDPANPASQHVCRKLGFAFLKQAPVDGDVRNIYTLAIGDTGDKRRGMVGAGSKEDDPLGHA